MRTLTRSIAVFDDTRDLLAAAKARLDLARAMIAAGDPAARPVLEDAGTLFEELGDEDSVLAVDRLLREAESALEAAPSSFRRPSTVPPPPLA